MADSSIIDALIRLHLLRPGEDVTLTPLTGGVSSDIQLVETETRRFCVKRALAQLKVSAVWEAPVERNAAEAEWLRTVRPWQPTLVPELLGEDREAGLFAMEYLPPEDHPVWKQQLLAGRVDTVFAAQMGSALGVIHRRSSMEHGLAGRFANDALFDALRLDPYLRATARVHTDLAPALLALVDVTDRTKHVLMHGDVSPKNILIAPHGPVLLDAECACFGDPAFDLAFLLNHMLLKATLKRANAAAYLSAYEAIATAYLAEVNWEDRLELEQRCARLLAGLLLARIDGKSPVEYLVNVGDKTFVRQTARHFLAQPPERLAQLANHWMTRND